MLIFIAPVALFPRTNSQQYYLSSVKMLFFQSTILWFVVKAFILVNSEKKRPTENHEVTEWGNSLLRSELIAESQGSTPWFPTNVRKQDHALKICTLNSSSWHWHLLGAAIGSVTCFLEVFCRLQEFIVLFSVSSNTWRIWQRFFYGNNWYHILVSCSFVDTTSAASTSDGSVRTRLFLRREHTNCSFRRIQDSLDKSINNDVLCAIWSSQRFWKLD